jgi:hypothetical protein
MVMQYDDDEPGDDQKQPDDEAAAEQQAEEPGPEEETLPRGAKALIFGGTLVPGLLIDVASQGGIMGAAISLIVAYGLSRHSGDLLEAVGGTLPRPAPRTSIAAPRERREKRSLGDRLMGRHPVYDEEEAVIVDDEEETGTGHLSSHAREVLIDLAGNLHVHKNDLAGKAIFICGMRRHGKTTLGALLAEQLGAHYLPLFIPDLEGDYLRLADVLPRAVIAGHSRASEQYRAYEFAALDSVQAAYQLGYDLLERGYQVILDLASYTTLDAALAIQINIIRGLFHWTNSHPDKRVPCHVFLDEAQRYLPQTLSDSVILDRSVLGGLLKCYMDIIASGGKRGLAPVILTQRFAQVNNKIMAQSEVFFLLRQTHDTDLERCMKYVNSEIATKEQIARFQPGQGVYIASDGSQIVTRFHHRASSGERSATPPAEAAYRYAHMPLFRPAREAAVEAVPSADQSSRRVTAPPLHPATPEAGHAPLPPEPTLLERGVTAYLEGATSQPKLAAALKISPWDARKLMPEIEAEVRRLQAREQP